MGPVHRLGPVWMNSELNWDKILVSELLWFLWWTMGLFMSCCRPSATEVLTPDIVSLYTKRQLLLFVVCLQRCWLCTSQLYVVKNAIQLLVSCIRLLSSHLLDVRKGLEKFTSFQKHINILGALHLQAWRNDWLSSSCYALASHSGTMYSGTVW